MTLPPDSGAPYRPPPIAGPDASQGRPLRIRAVALGLAADWLGTYAASTLILLVASVIAASRSRNEAEIRAYIEQLIQAPDFVILSSLVGIGFVAFGGYVCARLATYDELKHAAIMGAVSLGLGLAIEWSGSGGEQLGWYPTWLRALGHLLVIPAALAGAALARSQE